MAKKQAEVYEQEPWDRQPGESTKAYEAFAIYRDLGPARSVRRVSQQLGKSRTLIGRWCTDYDWVKRCEAWDAEQDRIARQEMLADMAATRKKQRKNAKRMQERGMEFLESVVAGEPALKDIVQLLKVGMEQERIALGDVGEVIEERNGGEPVSPVQIYIPSNGREKEESFDDLEA